MAGPRALGWIVGATVCLAASTARAGNDEDGRPWARGTWGVGPVLGFGFGPDVTNLEFGVTGEYYVLHGWSFGAELSDEIFIYSSQLRAEFPGLQNQLATNAFSIIPRTRYVFYRSYRFSPWALAGIGPVFFNHDGGTVGQWVAGPGAYIGLGGPVYLSLGVTFSGMFPRSSCDAAFDYVDPMSPDTRVQFELNGAGIGSLCGFNWTPQIGIVFAPRAKTRRERKEEQRRRRPPPPNPMFQPLPEDEAPEPVAPTVDDVDPPPSSPDSDAPDDAGPQPDEAATDPATDPATDDPAAEQPIGPAAPSEVDPDAGPPEDEIPGADPAESTVDGPPA